MLPDPARQRRSIDLDRHGHADVLVDDDERVVRPSRWRGW
jgi:hypothetical protein